MRLLLVEDDKVIARELGLRWQRPGWAVLSCKALREATAALHQGAFDLIVLDLGLPDGDGLDWLAQWRMQDPNTPVLVLTARDRVSDRVRGLQTGADDYLVKPFAAEELDARIAVLARRAQRDAGDVARFGTVSWVGSQGRAYCGSRVLDLAPREFEVLGMLVRRAPHLVHKRVLTDALAERNLELGCSAAEVYVSRLRRKLEGTGLGIRTLRGFGYVLQPEFGDAAATDSSDT